jgi:propionyl-CoA carboxylase alpha chain
VLADIEDGLVVTLPEEDRALTLTDVDWRPGQPLFRGVLDGRAFTATVETADEGFFIRHRAARVRVLVLTPVSSAMHERLPEKVKADTSKLVVSPMPGLVVTMEATAGQTVREGEVVCIIEAMKMQNIIRAEREGVVKAVNAAAGDSVAADDVLVEFA